jgi:pimeloyl-ACP methyl ester carboxylesterase
MYRNCWLLGLVILVIFGCHRKKETKTKHMEKQAFESGYATVNGLKMYYETHGSGGIPLVLVHGGGSTIQTTFGQILPLLASQGKVIAVELQAHGHSGDRDGPVTFEQDADDVAALLAHLKIGKANFLGFSNGGSTTLQIAIRHPGMVNKLVVASAIYKRSGMFDGFFEMMPKATLESMPAPLKTAYLEVAPDKNHLEIMHNKDRDRMVEFKDWPESSIRSIEAPTLVIVGDKDVVKPEHALELSRLLQHAELLVLPGTHGEFFGEICSAVKGSKIPELTVGLIEDFLKK